LETVFNYDTPLYEVAAVDEQGYQNCNAINHPKKIYTSGHDRIALEKGQNYFICSTPDYCGYGMKIAINAK
jgi:hypothetical protein